jgi:hypothetical protein
MLVWYIHYTWYTGSKLLICSPDGYISSAHCLMDMGSLDDVMYSRICTPGVILPGVILPGMMDILIGS